MFYFSKEHSFASTLSVLVLFAYLACFGPSSRATFPTKTNLCGALPSSPSSFRPSKLTRLLSESVTEYINQRHIDSGNPLWIHGWNADWFFFPAIRQINVGLELVCLG
ncbi:unnamed protein product, partial [Vitis vinifera]|uniref:Uncharacterized protein n=1 Tax=Vitis vinifera TaxID=29760 RepID=D7TXN9_VITVI